MIMPSGIENIVSSPSKLAILRFFALRKGAKATGREVAKEIKYSAPSTHEALKALQSHNILNLEIIGKQHIYSLNENDRLVQKVIRPMFEVESGTREEVTNFLLKELKANGVKQDIVSIMLYGSVQKGTAKPGSDMDIAVVVNKQTEVEKIWDLFVTVIASKFSTYFGVHLDAYVKSATEFRARLKENQPPVSTLMKSYSVLYGKEPLEV